MSINDLPTRPHAYECAVQGCRRPATAWAVDELSADPEAYCQRHLWQMSREPRLRPRSGPRKWVWRSVDEIHAHHHVLLGFVAAGAAVLLAQRPWLTLTALGLLAVLVAVDAKKLLSGSYALWPLSIPLVVMGFLLAGWGGGYALSGTGLLCLAVHVPLLSLHAHRVYADRYPG